MDIDDEYLIDETTAATPDETPTPTTSSIAPITSGIKLKLTLNGKNKNISNSSSSTTTPTNNAEAGPSNVRTGARSKRPAAVHSKADAAAFEDDASQASASGTNKGKSTRASKRVKLDVSSG